MRGSHAAERHRGPKPAPAPGAPRRSRPARPARLVRVDRLTLILAGIGLALVLVATVFVTLLLAGDTNGGSAPRPAGATRGPSITLSGPEVARYITDNYGERGVTCPTLRVPVGGAFVCSDADGNSFTVQIIDQGRAYTVHPN